MDDEQLVNTYNKQKVFLLRKVLARLELSDWIASAAALASAVSLIVSFLGYRRAAEQTDLS